MIEIAQLVKGLTSATVEGLTVKGAAVKPLKPAVSSIVDREVAATAEKLHGVRAVKDLAAVEPGDPAAYYRGEALRHPDHAPFFRSLGTLWREISGHARRAIREIATSFHPTLLESWKRRLEERFGSQRVLDPETFETYLNMIAGACAECDLVANPAWQAELVAMIAEFRTGKRIPAELADVVFDPTPIIARLVRTGGFKTESTRLYVDIQVGFRGTRKNGEAVFLGVMRTQSKLDNAASLFGTGWELVGQLVKDDMRWGAGPLELDGTPYLPHQIFELAGGQRIAALATRDITPAEARPATLAGLDLVTLRHRFSARTYRDTARAILKGLGFRKAPK